MKQALPPEHGSWAFVLEPILIAIAMGASPGVWGLFLAYLGYRPLAMAGKDLARRKRYPRTAPNLLSGAGLVLAGGGLALSALDVRTLGILAALGILFAVLDLRSSARSLGREVLGGLLLVPVAVAYAPGWSSLSVLLGLRPLVAILSIRGIFDRTDDASVCARAGIGLGLLMATVAAASGPGIGVALASIYAALGLRVVWLGLSIQLPRKATRVGIVEALLSLAVVLAWFVTKPG